MNGNGSVSYTAIADRYEQLRGGAVRAAELAAAIRPWLPGGIVCDVGAGTGVVTEQLRRPGITLLACDLSFEMLTQASPRLPGRLHVVDATALALRDQSVDALVYVWVLHHVGDLAAALGEARRVLRPGGRAIAISGMSAPMDDDMSPVLERLNDQLKPGWRDQATAVARSAIDARFEITHEGSAVSTGSTSPHALADAIAARGFSHVWDLTDRQWATFVQPAIDELRSLPNPDEVRPRLLRHPLLVVTKR